MSRPRNSLATKQAIIAAARRCFAQSGYDQVGLREIAAVVGVDKRHLTRIFGSKATLFAEALDSARLDHREPTPDVVDNVETTLPRVFESGQMSSEERNDYVLLCLQSASSVEARAVVRAALEADIRRHAETVTGGDKAVRAAMVLSVLFGVTLTREIVQAEPLASADAGTMTHYMALVLRLLGGNPREADARASSDAHGDAVLEEL